MPTSVRSRASCKALMRTVLRICGPVAGSWVTCDAYVARALSARLAATIASSGSVDFALTWTKELLGTGVAVT